MEQGASFRAADQSTLGDTGKTAITPAWRRATPEQPLRVLLAEDSPIVRQRMVALINGLGRPIRVAAAADGTEARRLFNETNPEAAVLDIALPDTTGFDLLAKFKAKRPACVVMM